MYKCMHVCTYARMHVCMYVCMYVEADKKANLATSKT